MKITRTKSGEWRQHFIGSTSWRRLALMSILLGILAMVGSVLYIDKQYAPKGERYTKMAKSSNYVNGKFQNLVPTEIMSAKSYFPMLKDYILGKEIRYPQSAPPVMKPDSGAFTDSKGDGLRITWLGHSSTIIEIERAVILTDPVFSKKISPSPLFAPKRFHENFPVDIKDLPEIDAVIISHNHYDHLDYKTIKELHEKTRHFYVPLGVGAYLEKWGVTPKKNNRNGLVG